MKKIDRKELIERTKHSNPYPVGDEALASYYAFFKQYEHIHEVRVLAVLMKLNEVECEGHRIVLFDQPRLQQAYQEMGAVIPQAFTDFLFES